MSYTAILERFRGTLDKYHTPAIRPLGAGAFGCIPLIFSLYLIYIYKNKGLKTNTSKLKNRQAVPSEDDEFKIQHLAVTTFRINTSKTLPRPSCSQGHNGTGGLLTKSLHSLHSKPNRILDITLHLPYTYLMINETLTVTQSAVSQRTSDDSIAVQPYSLVLLETEDKGMTMETFDAKLDLACFLNHSLRGYLFD